MSIDTGDQDLWKWVVGILFGIINFLLARTVTNIENDTRKNKADIDKLQSESVSREEFNDTINALRKEVAESRSEVLTRIDSLGTAVSTRLDRMVEYIANINRKGD